MFKKLLTVATILQFNNAQKLKNTDKFKSGYDCVGANILKPTQIEAEKSYKEIRTLAQCRQ